MLNRPVNDNTSQSLKRRDQRRSRVTFSRNQKYRDMARSVAIRKQRSGSRHRPQNSNNERATWQSQTKSSFGRARGKSGEENDCPTGKDEEFWFQAEREFLEAEELAKQIPDDE